MSDLCHQYRTNVLKEYHITSFYVSKCVHCLTITAHTHIQTLHNCRNNTHTHTHLKHTTTWFAGIVDILLVEDHANAQVDNQIKLGIVVGCQSRSKIQHMIEKHNSYNLPCAIV